MAQNVVLENCRLIFRNFAGEEKKYNPAGQRNFGVILDPAMVEQCEAVGFPIKTLNPRDEDELPLPWIKVKVSYSPVRPNIYMVSGKTKTLLDETTVGMLDYAEIENVDIVLSPYHWTVGDKEGVTAYVKNMYVTITQDELASKYNFDDESEELPFD